MRNKHYTGQVVTLVSGGPKLTVTKVDAGVITALGFDVHAAPHLVVAPMECFVAFKEAKVVVETRPEEPQEAPQEALVEAPPPKVKKRSKPRKKPVLAAPVAKETLSVLPEPQSKHKHRVAPKIGPISETIRKSLKRPTHRLARG